MLKLDNDPLADELSILMLFRDKTQQSVEDVYLTPSNGLRKCVQYAYQRLILTQNFQAVQPVACWSWLNLA
jgi:hypothetical protein